MDAYRGERLDEGWVELCLCPQGVGHDAYQRLFNPQARTAPHHALQARSTAAGDAVDPVALGLEFIKYSRNWRQVGHLHPLMRDSFI